MTSDSNLVFGGAQFDSDNVMVSDMESDPLFSILSAPPPAEGELEQLKIFAERRELGQLRLQAERQANQLNEQDIALEKLKRAKDDLLSIKNKVQQENEALKAKIVSLEEHIQGLESATKLSLREKSKKFVKSLLRRTSSTAPAPRPPKNIVAAALLKAGHGALESVDQFLPGMPIVVPRPDLVPSSKERTIVALAQIALPFAAVHAGAAHPPQAPLMFERPERFVKMTVNVQPIVNGGRIQVEQYDLDELLGRGSFGHVFKGQDRITGRAFAVKVLGFENIRKNRHSSNLIKLARGKCPKKQITPQAQGGPGKPTGKIKSEVAILTKLNHPNIVRLYEALECSDINTMLLVFELCQGELVKCPNVLSESDARECFQQVIYGVEYLHEHNIIHRDIKPANILRCANGKIKIADFGVSVMFSKSDGMVQSNWTGSKAFRAPEHAFLDCNSKCLFTTASDIWAMGVTLFMMCCGRAPFSSQKGGKPFSNVIMEDDFADPRIDDPYFRELLKKILHKNPLERITMDKLREDSWVTDCGRRPMISKEQNLLNVVTDMSGQDLERAVRDAKLGVIVKDVIETFNNLPKSRECASAERSLVSTLEQRHSYKGYRNSLPKEFFDRESSPKDDQTVTHDSNTAVDQPLSDPALVPPEDSEVPQEEEIDREIQDRATLEAPVLLAKHAAVRTVAATELPMFDMVYRRGSFPVGMVPETFSAVAIKPERIAMLMKRNASLAELHR
ncbi:hypothetical protein EMPS_01620 [Entomortierella parvispora]|uniref:Protein kinase domain-containing protein n=1 Tax=Entomortierella parvispora TaxID=205924 RepID=A0A9P3H3A8_9FUNG|nr:hypothetical protein EMPS_01620 [Entomortierella parvispora]